MAEATANPVEIEPRDIRSSLLSTEVQTTAENINQRAAALIKVVHPPKAVPNFDGLPTNDARSQVVLQYVTLKTFTTPVCFGLSYHPAATGLMNNTDTASLKVALLVPNGVENVAFVFVYSVTDGRWYQDLANTVKNNQISAANFVTSANMYRPCYKSITSYLNATSFNDQGTAAVAQFNPSIVFGGALGDFINSHLDLAANFIASKFNKGQIQPIKQSDKWLSIPEHARRHILNKCKLGDRDHLDIDPGNAFQLLNLSTCAANNTGASSSDSFVPFSTEILNFSQRAYAGMAKEGTFAVSRLNTVSPSWRGAGTVTATAPLFGNLPQIEVMWYDGAGAQHFDTMLEPTAPGVVVANLVNARDTWFTSDMTFQWHIYEGITPNEPVLTQQTEIPLIIKGYCGYEVQPSLQSAWSGLQKLAPKPDIKVMQDIMTEFYDLKDGMPARFNFLGTVIKTGAKYLGRTALRLASKTANDYLRTTATKSEKRSNKPIPVVEDQSGNVYPARPPRRNTTNTTRKQTNRKSEVITREKNMAKQISDLQRQVSRLTTTNRPTNSKRMGASKRRK